MNTADTGVVVYGDDVTAYGLVVENYQKYEVIWIGRTTVTNAEYARFVAETGYAAWAALSLPTEAQSVTVRMRPPSRRRSRAQLGSSR